MPAATVATTKEIRSSSGSTPIRRPRPAHTPVRTPLAVSRRSGARGARPWATAVMGRFCRGAGSGIVAAGEAAGEQDHAQDGEHDGPQRGEADVEPVEAVEQEEEAEHHDRRAADEGGR